MSNYFIRSVFKRPEMFYLSLESNIKALDYYKPDYDIVDVFLVEYGAPKKIFEIIDNYSYNKKIVIKRNIPYGDPKNVLEGIKEINPLTSDRLFYCDDDVILHRTYYKYVDLVFDCLGHENLCSVLGWYPQHNSDDINNVIMCNLFAGPSNAYSKSFIDDYIIKHINNDYYSDKPGYVCRELNNKYKKYWDCGVYKIHDSRWHCWDGVMNRSVDIAFIEDRRVVVLPASSRAMHIGYYGHNRPGGVLPGTSFDERLKNLRNIIKDASVMYEYSGKMYNDNMVFNENLDKWSGDLCFTKGDVFDKMI